MALKRVVNFECRIQITEDPKVINEMVTNVCIDIQKVLDNIIKKKNLDAMIKKVMFTGMTGTR